MLWKNRSRDTLVNVDGENVGLPVETADKNRSKFEVFWDAQISDFYTFYSILDYALQSRQREAWMWFQFQSDDLLRANTSHLRIMSKGALAAWIEPRFGIPVLLTSCQKGPQKGPGNWSPMCSLCSLTSLFEVFCLKPSKSWFQTTSRQNDVSRVHDTFAEMNYFPKEEKEKETSVRNHAQT